MANPAKRKGDGAEREAALLLANLTGYPVRRRLGAGRADDCGDLDGIPSTCIQVKNHRTIDRLPTWLGELEVQQANAKADFGALFLRRPGGLWIAMQTPAQFTTLLREAIAPAEGAA